MYMKSDCNGPLSRYLLQRSLVVGSPRKERATVISLSLNSKSVFALRIDGRPEELVVAWF